VGVVYCIENITNAKKYIGIDSRGEDIRWHEHLYSSKHNPTQLIDRKIKEYGADNFVYSILYRSENIVELKEAEIQFILNHSTFISNGYGYNLTYGGEDNPMNNEIVRKRHLNAMASISGENHYMFGKHWSDEEREKRRHSMIGKNVGDDNGSKKPDARRKISEKAKLRVGGKNSNYKHGRRVGGRGDPEYTAKYYQEHKEAIKLKAKERYARNREYELERARKYHQTHKKIKGHWSF